MLTPSKASTIQRDKHIGVDLLISISLRASHICVSRFSLSSDSASLAMRQVPWLLLDSSEFIYMSIVKIVYPPSSLVAKMTPKSLRAVVT